MKIFILFFILSSAISLSGCAQNPPSPEQIQQELNQITKYPAVFGANKEFTGSPYPDIGHSGLFSTHHAADNHIAILNNGDDSFAARIQSLKKADTSIRIQALVFTADEAGLYIAEILKQKKQQGLDVRVIVDAFSNPKFQTQRMFFDLKQNGIEVEGYETMLLQWINEVPIPFLMPHAEHGRMDKRFHEKMWLIDGETDHAVAVVGGLNIANEYFRVDANNPDFFWRDQDVIVRGKVINDMVAAFDRNFDYFISIKKSRGIFNTNLYWEQTRKFLSFTGKIKFTFHTEDRLDKQVRKMSRKKLALDYHQAKARFFQNRPRYKETYINQAYLKLIMSAEKEILIANAYLIPSQELIIALQEAARRCVQIKLLSNSTITNDLPEITMVGRESFQELLSINNESQVKQCAKNHSALSQSAGIQIWEWQGKKAKSKHRTEGTMHSKYAVFDNKTSLVGSYNLDPRSENLNSESALIFENTALAEKLSHSFHHNDLLFSQQISMLQAEEFIQPKDTLYNIEKKLGDSFKDEL